MHASITVQPTLYITVLHTSHILVYYKYTVSRRSSVVHCTFGFYSRLKYMRHKLLLPYKSYFHPEVHTHAPFSIYALLAHERRVTLRMRPM